MKSKLGLAIEIASTAHAGQVDRGGKPYILHCLDVMYRVMKYTDYDNTHCAAVLHDVVEDTSVTLNDLLREGMTEDCVYTVDFLTKKKIDDEDYLEIYYKSIAQDKSATIIKICDLEHNMDLSRLKKVTDKDLARYAEYSKRLEYLKNILRDGYGVQKY